MKRIFFSLIFLSASFISSTQNSELKLQDFRPTSPSAFEFLKYTDMPVSQYTGIADLSVPLYQFVEDGVTVPLTLKYHSGGIRVSQEASWVGLGWDLHVGSIVQEINDMDDYGNGITRLLPDWNESPVPSFYSKKYSNMFDGTLAPGYSDIVSVDPPKSLFSFRIYSSYLISVGSPGPNYSTGFTGAHNYYLPLNGNRDNQPSATDVVNNPNYDSEPDIFSANFLGHSIRFIRNPQNSQIVVLNKKGYSVSRTNDIYKIVVPSGEEYYFEQFITVTSHSQTVGGIGVAGLSSTTPLPSSKIWMMTKVITNNKRQILFTYTQSNLVDNYPGYSEKSSFATNGVTNPIVYGTHVEGFPQVPVTGIGKTYSYSTENRFYLSSITMANGQINFTTSARTDMLGAKKLDGITVASGGNVIKSYILNYGYFDASSVGGNKFTPSNAALFGSMPDLRLKLLSVEDNIGARHDFYYNSTPLPSKNSLAQDFWGYYNGQITNSSLIPNPARLNSTQLCSSVTLADNGNNNSANLQYAQAAILTAVKYPTGGTIDIEYELNTFDNYWVPDFSTTSNQISSGNGLRVKAINYKETSTVTSKKTTYVYSGGKALTPLKLCRQYTLNSLDLSLNLSTAGNYTNYLITEFSAKGFYSSNSLGSGSGVGYTQVTHRDVDANGLSLGKTITNYNNESDVAGVNASSSSQLSISLPSIKKVSSVYGNDYSTYPENGTTSSVSVYNNLDQVVKQTAYTYETQVSPLFYGARIFGSAAEYFVAGNFNPTSGTWVSAPKAMTGYYPIFDINTYNTQVVTTEFDGNGNNLVTTEELSYNIHNILSSKRVYRSQGGSIQEEYYHPESYYTTGGINLLWSSNRLTDVIRKRTTVYHANGGASLLSEQSREYAQSGNKIVVSKLIVEENPKGNSQTTEVLFEVYDAYGNACQVSKLGEKTSYLWGYDGKYLIAEVKNGAFADIAYTSFEDNTHGNWSITPSGIDNSVFLTGRKSYNLIYGALSKNGLGAGTYIVSYWSKNGPKTVNGTSAIAGRVVLDWGYFEHQIVNPASGTITVSGTGIIDEVRLYPKDAQMSSWTYAPLVGITSSSDLNNVISYYQYDAIGRLILMRDQDQNVLKKICYNFAGQPENCTTPCINVIPLWENTQTPLVCEQNGNGQNTGYRVQEQKDINPCSPSYNQTRWLQITYNTTLCPLPPACNSGNCVGNDKKCVNAVCETGTWQIISSIKINKTTWECTYAYCFSDGSTSTYTQTISTNAPCAITCF